MLKMIIFFYENILEKVKERKINFIRNLLIVKVFGSLVSDWYKYTKIFYLLSSLLSLRQNYSY